MDRLELWEAEIDRNASSMRQRRERLEEDRSICLQLEASLVELTHEIEAMSRSLDGSERQLKDRRLLLSTKMDELSSTLLQTEEGLRQLKDRQANVVEELDEAWRSLEDELKSLDSLHAYEVSKMRKTQRESDDREAMLRENLRAATERERELHQIDRKIKRREAVLLEMNRASLDRKIAELQERENFLHDESGL